MASNPRSLSLLPRLSAVALVIALSGCGGSSPSGPSNNPTPVPVRTRSVILSFSFQMLGVPAARKVGFAFDFVGQAFSLASAGDLDGVVDWTFASNDVNLYLTSNTCTEAQFKVVACTIMRSTESVNGKPKTLTSPGLAAGNYKIWVVNLGDTAESGNVQVGVTR